MNQFFDQLFDLLLCSLHLTMLLKYRVQIFDFFGATMSKFHCTFTLNCDNLKFCCNLTIIALVIAGTLAPCVMANPKETPFQGEGIAKYLLAEGADINAKFEPHGDSSFELAERSTSKGGQEVYQLLKVVYEKQLEKKRAAHRAVVVGATATRGVEEHEEPRE